VKELTDHIRASVLTYFSRRWRHTWYTRSRCRSWFAIGAYCYCAGVLTHHHPLVVNGFAITTSFVVKEGKMVSHLLKGDSEREHRFINW